MARPVVWFDIATTDGPTLFGFYQELFGWEIDSDNPTQYGMVSAAEGGIGGGIGTAQDGAARGVSVYVDVDDAQAYLTRAETLGGKTVVPPYEVPGVGMLAEFTDPQGNRIGVWQR
jgi:uncharacterized protein